MAMAVPLVGCGSHVDLELVRRFQLAEEQFAAGQNPADFLEVAGMYDEILGSGCMSSAVLYNQGNAFSRAGQFGRALASYRQAQRLRPRDPHLDANLRSCLSSLGQPPTKPAVWDYVLFWRSWLSFSEKLWLTTGLLAATLLLLLGDQLTPVHRVPRILVIGLATLTLAMAASGVWDWYDREQVQHGVLIMETTARKGNSESYAAAFNDSLVEGTEFIGLETRDDWLRIRLPGTGEGWIPRAAAVVY